MSALLAEKRKAKAAEIAASKVAQESPRIVSGPIPNSPSVQQGLPRSSSSSVIAPRSKTAPISRSNSDADVSPSRDRRSPNATIKSSAAAPQTTPRAASKTAFESPSERVQVARAARSPDSSTSSVGSPSRTKSPLRQSTTTLSRVRSPTASSATSGVQALRTPTLQRKPLPSFSADRGLGSTSSPNEPASTQRAHADRRDPSRAAPASPSPGIVQEGLRAQAEQAESAARQLLDFDDGLSSNLQNVNVPITPARPPKASMRGTINGAGTGAGAGAGLLSTPANQGIVRQPWEDSPRNMAITPKMLSNLKNRKSEKTWWLRQQQRE
jgi:CLIP-associating protein 1/2